eukprot:s647_g15.t1
MLVNHQGLDVACSESPISAKSRSRVVAGEGWGRPHVEAMSMALPVIATNWSGSTEFLHSDVSLPLPLDGLEPAENGHGQWAQPSREQLRRLMRYLQQHPREGKAIGEAARQRMVERFSPEKVVSQHILPLLQRWQRGSKSKKSEL